MNPEQTSVNHALGSLITTIENIPMPPSVNSLYFTNKGRRTLSSEGRQYKDMIHGLVATKCRELATVSLENVRLAISYDFYFNNVETKSWLKKKSATRFRKIDISNRVKVLEDGVSESLGIDDSQFMNILLTKNETDKDEYVNIRIYNCEV
jgi:Holliday junction resolvase RusA-like endonuclease